MLEGNSFPSLRRRFGCNRFLDARPATAGLASAAAISRETASTLTGNHFSTVSLYYLFIHYFFMPLNTKRPFVLFLFIIPFVLFFIALGVYGWKTVGFAKNARAQYQAVFLTNGQVYFGHVQDRNAQYLKLTDVYYLQSVAPLQAPQPLSEEGKKKDGKDAAPSPQPTQPELTLVKLGQELHGPQDRMDINRDQVLFIEDLRDEGKVADAIKRYASK